MKKGVTKNGRTYYFEELTVKSDENNAGTYQAFLSLDLLPVVIERTKAESAVITFFTDKTGQVRANIKIYERTEKK